MKAEGRASEGPTGRHIANAIFGNALPPLATLLTAPILARSLGLDDRGALAAGAAPLALLSILATLGLPEAVTHLVAKRAQVSASALRFALLLTAAAVAASTLMLFLLRGVLAGGSSSTADLLTISCFFVLPTVWLGVLRGLAAGLQRWRLIALERCIGASARLLLVGGLAINGQLTYRSAGLAMFAAPLIGFVAYAPLRATLRDAREAVAHAAMASFGARLWVGAGAGVLLARVDQSLLLPLSSAAELGLYIVAVNISEVPQIVSAAFRDVVFATDSRQRSSTRTLRAARLASTFSLLVAVPVLLTIELWLVPVFGPAFADAAEPTRILVLAVALGTAGSIAGASLSGQGRPGLRSTSLSLALLLNVLAIFVLVPSMGAVGAAYAALCGNLLASALNIVLVCRLTGWQARAFFGIRRQDLDGLRQVLSRQNLATGNKPSPGREPHA